MTNDVWVLFGVDRIDEVKAFVTVDGKDYCLHYVHRDDDNVCVKVSEYADNWPIVELTVPQESAPAWLSPLLNFKGDCLVEEAAVKVVRNVVELQSDGLL